LRIRLVSAVTEDAPATIPDVAPKKRRARSPTPTAMSLQAPPEVMTSEAPPEPESEALDSELNRERLESIVAAIIRGRRGSAPGAPRPWS
jgi:hypothetical protein